MSKQFSKGIEQMIQLSKENENFKNELRECKNKEAVLTLLKDNGIAVTTEELQGYINEKSELTDNELDQVSGGCFIHGDVL